MTLRLLQRLWDHARDQPDRCALLDLEMRDRWSWRQLLAATQFVSGKLLADLTPGKVVLLCAENEPAFIAAFLGILQAGLKAYCVSPAAAAAELTAAAEEANAAAVIGSQRSVAILGANRPALQLSAIRRDLPFSQQKPADSTHAALLLQSSGTTGTPRIVRRSAASLDAISETMCTTIGFSRADCVLAAAPLCHSYGLEHGLLAPIWAGSRVHLCRRFDVAAALGELRREVTILPGVPFMFEALAQSETKAPSLRRAYSAGGPLTACSAERFAAQFGVQVGQVYGATEVGSVTFNDSNLPGYAPASVGRPMKGVVVQFDPQSAQVRIQSPWMFDGHLGESDRVAGADFATGDIGHLDGDGNLFITGRLKLIVDVGGRKVNPLEVEAILSEHPGVAQCVVIPMPLAGNVTRLKALVIPRQPSKPPSPADMRQYVRRRLASYKVPRVFELREQLPLSPTGKILRHLIEG
jgi:acyl-CoA synthetase (AMP-forming)/AMP-acid ligase II